MASALQAELRAEHADLYRPRYNVAPTDLHWILRLEADHPRLMVPGFWGMPGPGTAGVGHINARSETAAQKPAFRGAFVDTRCGVIADGFFEWTGPKDNRRPVWFHRPGHRVMVFAGLYRMRPDPLTGETTPWFTILTTAPNPVVAELHDRMPAILDEEDIDLWLAAAPEAEADREGFKASLQSVLHPASPEFLVSKL